MFNINCAGYAAILFKYTKLFPSAEQRTHVCIRSDCVSVECSTLLLYWHALVAAQVTSRVYASSHRYSIFVCIEFHGRMCACLGYIRHMWVLNVCCHRRLAEYSYLLYSSYGVVWLISSYDEKDYRGIHYEQWNNWILYSNHVFRNIHTSRN